MQTIDFMRADSPVSGHSAEWYFFRSYIETAFWSTNDISDGEPLDSNYDMSDLSPETLAAMLADCAAFYDAKSAYIHCDDAPLARDCDTPRASEASQAGHDFWLTRCGHGAGFWDGDWPEPAASVLTKAATAFGHVDLYVGDDGRIYAA